AGRVGLEDRPRAPGCAAPAAERGHHLDSSARWKAAEADGPRTIDEAVGPVHDDLRLGGLGAARAGAAGAREDAGESRPSQELPPREAQWEPGSDGVRLAKPG